MTTINLSQAVRDFMLAGNQEMLSGHPDLMKEWSPEFRLLVHFRHSLVHEECMELFEAIRVENAVDLADALGDILYVVIGFLLALGIDIDALMDEIHRSNMTKFFQHKSVEGKVLKPEHYKKPNIAKALGWID